MRLHNTFPVSYTILLIFISVLAHFAFSSQQSDHDAVATQNEELAIDYIKTFNSNDVDIPGIIMETGAEMLPKSVVLEACYEQLGVFNLPPSEAEPYLPEGFEPYLDPSLRFATLSVWSIECEPVHEKEDPLNMVWVDIIVIPPETYRSDDAGFYKVPIRLFTSSPTLVETLHAFGIPQAELSDVIHEVNEQNDMERAGLANAAGGSGEVTMETQVAGSPTPSGEDGIGPRIFGVKDGRVTGMVDYISSDYNIMPGEASLTNNTFFSEQNHESVYSVHAWEIEFHLEPVEYR
jgi:hypothetical protein